MRPDFTPEATLAVVVGIERYDVGPRWALKGPALDAARFVKWLRARGVPARNILLFQSVLEANEAAANEILAPLGVAARAAKTTDIRPAIQAELSARAKDARLLYVFWGSHGAMESDDARRLFCEDAQPADFNPLNLTSLLGLLRSHPWSTMREQIVIVDACANYYDEMRYRERQADVTFTAGRFDSGADQLVLLAAASGQTAGNDPIRRTGAFSEVVQRILDATGTNEWPDFEQVARGVEREFVERTAAEGAQQRPVAMRWWRSNGASGSAGEYPMAESVQRVAMEGSLAVPQLRAFVRRALAESSLGDPAQRDSLVDALSPATRGLISRQPTDAESDLFHIFALTLTDAARVADLRAAIGVVEAANPAARDLLRLGVDQVRLAIAIRRLVGRVQLPPHRLRALFRRSAPDPQLAPDAHTLDEMIEALQDMSVRSPGAVPPVIEFVERIGQAIDDATLGAWVTNWSLGATGSVQPAIDLRDRVAREAFAAPVVWRVIVDASEAHTPTTSQGRHLRYWVYDGTGAPVENDVVPCVLSGTDTAEMAARRAMEAVHRVASARIDSAGAAATLAFELFVTLEQLIWDFDEWRLRDDDVDSLTFGVTSPLTLRWIERGRGQGSQSDADRRNAWRNVTKRVRGRIGNVDLATHWVTRDSKTPLAVQAWLRNNDYGTVVGLEFIPGFDQAADRERRLVRAVLYGGAPFVVWRRHPPSEWTSVRDSLDRFLNDPDFTDLPRRVVSLRLAALDDASVPGRSLAILWDDPDQNPLDALLSHNSQRTP